MNLREIGLAVRERRETVGLSQERLGRLSGLSRATINQLENGTLVDLGVSKLAILMDLIGLQLEAGSRKTARHGLRMARRSASVSYRTQLDAGQLARALATGSVPAGLVAHISTFIDEAPLPLVVSAVEEAAHLQGVPPKRIWRHVTRWAHDLQSPRLAWACVRLSAERMSGRPPRRLPSSRARRRHFDALRFVFNCNSGRPAAPVDGGRIPSRIAACGARCSGARCAYRSTIESDFHPPNSLIIPLGTPFWISRLAHVCRVSWKWKSSIPDFFSALRHAVLTVAFNGLPP
jgi:transcriptional regulator with XRE-family HTH domain